jgi:hypothetical protein
MMFKNKFILSWLDGEKEAGGHDGWVLSDVF